jgi:hypothetical protein
MQYKHFPLRQIELMFRNIHTAFAGETKEIRQEAFKAAVTQVMSSFATAGINGLPIGLLKPFVAITGALGITPTPAQIDDRTRRMLAGMFGATAANMIMDGMPSVIPHTPNAANMFSRNIDMMFGDVKHDDLLGYFLNDFVGAPGSVVADFISGAKAALSGNMGRAAQMMPAPRTLGDIVKAYGLHEHGATTATGKQLTPASDIDAFWRAMGFGTYQQARVQEGRAASEQEIHDMPKVTKGDQLKAKAKQTIMGITPSKRTEQMLRERAAVYQ